MRRYLMHENLDPSAPIRQESHVIPLDPKWVMTFLQRLDEQTRPAMRRIDREEMEVLARARSVVICNGV